jgi:hypothetical protein
MSSTMIQHPAAPVRHGAIVHLTVNAASGVSMSEVPR